MKNIKGQKEMGYLKLPKLLSDGCVLQREQKINIWGWAAPESVITVGIQGIEANTRASSSGSWKIQVGPLEAGGPFSLSVASSEDDTTRLIHQCYVGDVFLCSGQSNMELPMDMVKIRFPEEFDHCDDLLRNYKIVPEVQFEQSLDDHVEASWCGCNNTTIGDFSALAYFYGKELRETLNVPVGIVDASLGGSPIEAWLDHETVRHILPAMRQLQGYESDALAQKRHEESLADIREWRNQLGREKMDAAVVHDRDNLSWNQVSIPATLSQLGYPGFNGLVYLKKNIFLPFTFDSSRKASLHLGTLLDVDTTYVNGSAIGSSDNQYIQRDYDIDSGILHPGMNTIVVSLACENSNGRVTTGKRLSLDTVDRSYDLAGSWNFAVAHSMQTPCPAEDFIQWKPTVLYNGMLHPCLPMTAKAVLWYQGESNTAFPDDYEALMTSLIMSWRSQMENPQLPFYMIQLPGFKIDNPEDGGWAGVRNAQLHTALNLDNVETIVALDCGEWNDLHPKDKLTLGKRLAQAVLAQCFGIGRWNPVLPKEWTISERTGLKAPRAWHIEISFGEGAGSVQTLDGLAPGEFVFAWRDGSRQVVPASIHENTVVLDVNAGRKPDYVDYAYSSCPERGLLSDEYGTPVTPFIIDVAHSILCA
ncbi:MAG: sialate O-acetylesterase [Bifidobacteriaceae bacterium]|nr:sialate O-acetylesterase [Bifidobacteriaceae bacterium]MCI1914189.1 sialate O-acetylesterase [Bifidobacteriaceae bacterium]